jgi:ABC-type phosphate transport system substrate-binding protein
MKLRIAAYVLIFLCASLTPCFAHHTAVIVNKENSVENVTSAQLARMIRGDVKKWPDGKNVILVLHRDSAGEREALEHLNKMTASEWDLFLLNHKESIVFVGTDADVLKEVKSETGALGIIEVHSIDKSVNVLHLDGRLPMELGYLPH